MAAHRAWSPDFQVPSLPTTTQLRLEILSEEWVKLDYAALMGSRSRLREELRWKGWPPEGFTLEENRADLGRHHAEFLAHEAYAYTALDPSAEAALGCIYVEPWRAGAQLCFWVTDESRARGLERVLVEETLHWLQGAWSFPEVLLPLRASNPVGIALARSLGLEEHAASEHPEHLCFLWTPSL